MPNQPIPPFHNPNNLTPEQYGASEGWRLLRVSELGKNASEVQFFSYTSWSWVSCSPAAVIHDDGSYRTRAPDPFAPADSWVKMSERKPTSADYPIWVHDQNCKPDRIPTWHLTSEPCEIDFTHWRHTEKMPVPPARDLTQDEKDLHAHDEWIDGAGENVGTTAGIWFAALAYERARVSGK